jgi:hypothetical protein
MKNDARIGIGGMEMDGNRLAAMDAYPRQAHMRLQRRLVFVQFDAHSPHQLSLLPCPHSHGSVRVVTEVLAFAGRKNPTFPSKPTLVTGEDKYARLIHQITVSYSVLHRHEEKPPH